MTDPSPASIAVDDALAACIQLQGEIIRARPLAAAAIQAAADQVLPEEPLHAPASPLERGDQRWRFERDARQACRQKLLAIVAELKAIPDPS